MLVRDLEFDDKIEVEGKLQVPSLEVLEEFSPLNCRFFIQKWDITELTYTNTEVIGPIDVYSVVDQSVEIQEGLINLFNEFCKVLGRADETVEITQLLVNHPRRTREEEMKWMENNKELLAKLAGKWIAVEGSQLVAASEKFTEVSEKAKANGIKVPFIVYLPEPTTDSTIGI